jgi:hypothetical protein
MLATRVLRRGQSLDRCYTESGAKVDDLAILPWLLHVVLSNEEVRPLRENALYGIDFLKAFDACSGTDWTLDELDAAFASWQRAADRRGYTDEAVIELLGAMFGEHCNSQLNMRWIKLTDDYGQTLAVDGTLREFRGFPYQTIAKRIADSEHGFFRPVFALLKRNEKEASARSGGL